MNNINNAVQKVAAAYIAVRGENFIHLGVSIPLTADLLALAIQNNIVGALLQHSGGKQGSEDAIMMLTHMLEEDGIHLSELGYTMLDRLNQAFCADCRQMIDSGIDPMADLSANNQRKAIQ